MTVEAISAWGGVGANSEYICLLLINRDDENSHIVDIDIPAGWQVDSVIFESLYGTMINETVFTDYVDSPFTGSTYSAVLPVFSVNTVRIRLTNPLGLNEYNNKLSDAYIYPNPSSDFIYFTSKKVPVSVKIFNSLGQKVNSQISIEFDRIEINKLKKGIYFIQAIYSDRKYATYKFIKQ